jgi:hypothetical protein
MLEVPALAAAIASFAAFALLGNRGARAICAGTLLGAAMALKLLPTYLIVIIGAAATLDRRAGCSLSSATERPSRPYSPETPKILPSSRHLSGRAIAVAASRSRAECENLRCRQIHTTALARSFWDLFVVGATAALTFVGTDLLLERGAYLAHFSQTWASHFGVAKTTEYGSAAEHPFPWGLLARNWDATVPSLIGVVACVLQAWRSWRETRELPAGCVVPVFWLGFVLLLFGLHRPWWPYYYVHIAIPLSWCAAIGITAAVEWAFGDWFAAGPKSGRETGARSIICTAFRARPLAAGLVTAWLTVTACWVSARVYLEISGIRNSPQIATSMVLKEIARFKPFTQWMYTDEPIYSFHADIPMPPDLAVVVLKRFWAGEMTYERMRKDLVEYKPGVILLRNSGREPPFQALLQSDYRIVYEDNEHRLYAHKSISKKGQR